MIVSENKYFNKLYPENFLWLFVSDYKLSLAASFIVIEINNILNDDVIDHKIADIKVRELRYILNYIACIADTVDIINTKD